MKQYYESELIKEIVEARGHKKSSLHYESECVESWIEEAKGAYPKLCDYESEWLNYISKLDDMGGSEDTEPPIGEFPYVTLTDIERAVIDHVVPYAYKRAILNGQTLVNLWDNIGQHSIVSNDFVRQVGDCFKKSTKYLLKYNALQTNTKNSLIIQYYQNNTWVSNEPSHAKLNKDYFILTTPSADFNNIRLFNANSFGTETVILKDIMLIEYQDGMEKMDIPYFEGMQSVEMPVLTTSNEDGTKTIILTVNEDVKLGSVGEVKDELNCLTGEVTQRIGEIVLDGSEEWTLFDMHDVDGYSTFVASIPTLNNLHNDDVISIINDKFASTSWKGYLANKESETVWSHDRNKIGIRIKNEKASTVEEIKEFLSTNNIRINYTIATESIKTVDLNIQDQDGKTLSAIKPIEGTMFLSTSSDTIKPLFSGEIPVEAITQNLASFIDLEMEE